MKDLDGFSHIHLLYAFHLADGFTLHVKPFLDNRLRGCLLDEGSPAAQRHRPVRRPAVRIEENILHIEDVDVIDGTPLLDIKPYVPPSTSGLRSGRDGWRPGRRGAADVRSDRRFAAPDEREPHDSNRLKCLKKNQEEGIMFHEDRCDFCGDCLARCHYLPFDKETGAAAFRKFVEEGKATGSTTASPASPAMNTARGTHAPST